MTMRPTGGAGVANASKVTRVMGAGESLSQVPSLNGLRDCAEQTRVQGAATNQVAAADNLSSVTTGCNGTCEPMEIPMAEITCQTVAACVGNETAQASATSLPSLHGKIKIAPLQPMNVYIGKKCWPALVDSGAEVPLIHRRVLGETNVSTVGNILIQPIVGPAVEAKLVALDVARHVADTDQSVASRQASPLHVTFAVTERLNGHNVLLPASLAEELKSSSQHSIHLPCVEASSLHMPHTSVMCDQDNNDGIKAVDDNMIDESKFIRCDDVDYTKQMNDCISADPAVSVDVTRDIDDCDVGVAVVTNCSRFH
jgi:hypothetical protein